MKTLKIIVYGEYTDSEEKIEWPIVRSTEKAVQVETPGGTIWLPTWELYNRNCRFSARSINELIYFINEKTRNSHDAMIRVWKAGRGPSEKSHKYKFVVQVLYENEYRQEVSVLRRRTYALPVSQIRHEEKKWFVPAWVIKKKLNKNETLPPIKWPGFDIVRNQIKEIAERIIQNDTAKRERIKIRNEKRKLEEEDRKKRIAQERTALLAELNQKVEESGEVSLAYCRNNYSIRQLEKRGLFIYSWPIWPVKPNDIEGLKTFSKMIDIMKADSQSPSKRPKVRVPDKILENVTVEWVYWEGTSKQKVKIEQKEDGCTVRFYGSKREIVLPDGEIVVKMVGQNLKIYG